MQNKLRRGRETHLPRRSLCGEVKKSNWKGKPFLKVGKALLLGKHTPPVTLCSVTDSSGMTATGSHVYFHSLRGAQPPGKGFFRPFGADLFPFLSSLKMPHPEARVWHFLSYAPYPMGFWLCQRQESRHISARSFSAVQPRISRLLVGSA